MLYIEHLTKTFGEKKAVDDLSLHIAPGEIYGFIGHNGAGKTTTMHAISGLLKLQSDAQVGRRHPAVRFRQDHDRRALHSGRSHRLQEDARLHPG